MGKLPFAFISCTFVFVFFPSDHDEDRKKGTNSEGLFNINDILPFINLWLLTNDTKLALFFIFLSYSSNDHDWGKLFVVKDETLSLAAIDGDAVCIMKNNNLLLSSKTIFSFETRFAFKRFKGRRKLLNLTTDTMAMRSYEERNERKSLLRSRHNKNEKKIISEES